MLVAVPATPINIDDLRRLRDNLRKMRYLDHHTLDLTSCILDARKYEVLGNRDKLSEIKVISTVLSLNDCLMQLSKLRRRVDAVHNKRKTTC